jgi:MFS superfamily sulfate permease-like transporter
MESMNGLLSGSAEEDSIPKHIDVDVALPGLMICRFKVSLCYSNAEFFMNEVLSIVRTAPSRPRWLVLRFDSIDGVDYVAAKMLMELADRMGREQVALIFAELSSELRGFLSDFGVLEVVGSDKVFASVDAALAAFRHSIQRPTRAEDVVKI